MSLGNLTAADYAEPMRRELVARFSDGPTSPSCTLLESPLERTVTVRLYDDAINVALRHSFDRAVLARRGDVWGLVCESLDQLELQWRQARFYCALCAFAAPQRVESGFTFREAAT